MKSERKRTNIRTLVLMALFIAIIIVLGATPLGIIPIGPIGLTTVHIPVIIGSLMLGYGNGALLGFAFGTVSLLVATFTPFIGAFAFSPFAPGLEGYTGNPFALVVCYIPRILIGVITPLVFHALFKITKARVISYGGAALAGTLTNTVLVLSFVYIFFGKGYAEAVSLAHSALLRAMLTVTLTQGLPEALAAVLVTVALCRVIDFVKKKDEKRDIQKEVV